MKKNLFLLGVIFFSVSLVFAQASDDNSDVIELTVDKAVAMALENNMTIKQSKMDLDLQKMKKNYSWNSISPSLSLSGGIDGGKSGTTKTFSDAEITNSWSASGSIGLSLTPALATSIKAAQLSYESGELSYENARRSIELNVRKTFYSLLYFNKNLELQQRSLETAFETYKSNLSKYNQGRLSELNLLNSQYSYESKVPTVKNLVTTYDNNLDNFKIVLGLDLDDEIVLTGTLEDGASIELNSKNLDIDIEDIPSIKSLLKNIESSKNSLTATRFSAYAPSVSFSASVRSSGNLGSNGSSSMGAASNDPKLSVSYSATVRIPLDGYMPWSNGSLNIETQKEALEKQSQNLEQTKKTTEISIRNNYNSIKQAIVQLGLYEKNVELMQKTYDMTRTSYNAGSSDLLTLQKAEDNLYQAKYNVENQRYSIISAVLDLENMLGIEFGSLGKE